ncbi:hypothetical protein VPNG_00809 [Cytospora leucostoma]|uniref:Heterokaryon incompatibility domain-containing protein n=1 Tax=Cytospora leucostoma TaxID=1230097 RepID=A0A423XMZ7_9PEZI|nr:hypothetical protein VPNG_00809 [Cytospora leucostoma]
MPTRLLHITPSSGGTDDTPYVRLVLTGPEFSKDTEFAALSYCWGGRHGLQLEESNYQSLMEHIPFDKLPATIQDSIRVTIELGLQYLWVDALCIIQNQDSNKYWTEEAGKMCDIYQGCSIAIAASGASNSTEGLFAARDPLQQAECLIGTSLITLRLEPYRPQARDWALDTRGWALQEEILPARSIRFGSYVSWTCRELSVNEFGQIENEREEGNLPRDFFTRILEPQPANPVDEGETYELWRRIMYRYTSTKLSERSDRLVAIEGLRSAFEKRTGWACAGGLWQSFIMRELLWCRIGAEPSGLRPSWSWASMDGTLRLCPKQTDGYKDIAKLVGVSPSSGGRVAFDSPRTLELSGVLCRTGETSSRLWLKLSLFGEGWPDNRLYATYDDKTRMWMEGDMGLPLRADEYSGLDGLIVVPGRGSGTYKRVGYFFTVPMSKASGARVVERLVRSLEGSSEEPSIHQNLQLV